MPWFKVDDALHSHPKARKAGLEAMGLWVMAGSHCMAYLTDGFVDRWVVESWPNGDDLAQRLVDSGLWMSRWDTQGDSHLVSGWEYVDWHLYQPLKADVDESRRKERDRKAAWRNQQNQQVEALSSECPTGTTAGTPDGTDNGSHASPTRPDPIYKENGDFEAFWDSYPRRVGRKQAEKSYAKALKDITPESLLTAAKAYAHSVKDSDPKFIAHPSTWLNQGRWDEFQSSTVDPEAFLRDCWNRGTFGPISNLTGYPCPFPEFEGEGEPGFDKDIARRDFYRKVIADRHEELLMRVKEAM